MSEIIMREVRQGPIFVVCACKHEQQRCDICQDFEPVACVEPDKNSDAYMQSVVDDPAQM